jgi:hypothetical protein
MGRPSLSELFEPKYYEHLDGGILESFGRLFQRDLKLYVYPSLDRETGEIKTAELLELSPDLQQLYEYLQIKDWIVSLQDYKREYLTIWSREVLKRIEKSESGWEESVPDEVAEIIKQRGLFGWNRHRR